MINGRVLVIGCGGIGCELLKLLAKQNLRSITLIDCDTIDLSNLNRQFLFNRDDIGKNKAVVAARTFKKLNKKCRVLPICADITEFDAMFFARYKVVYSCLDNAEARSYVNQRCLISNTPLVDGGCGGFKGQAYYFDYNSECFDCIPRKFSKEYLMCTIRSRPTRFEHCIIWAKYVLLEMRLKVDENSQDFYQRFLKDVIENCEDMSTADKLEKFRNSEDYKERTKKIVEILGKLDSILFNKDNRDILEYIYNAAYIRGRCAGIEPISFDEAVTVAGNIIPSLSTINSIVASLMMLSVRNKCNYYSVDNGNVIRRLETCERNPECSTCSHHWYVISYDGPLIFRRLIRCFQKHSLELVAYSDKRLFLTCDMTEYLDKDLEFENNSIGEVICMENNKRVRIYLYFLRRGGNLSFRRIYKAKE
ncbi:SUMO ubiquitin activating enzyme E1 subunit UBA2 [Encephalitozoon romaleae SJ-2008]|uniref:SUMO ubiquitin activating enzyme E1 subunit UBA2 n=1 Tax=Encephalitozoon romaleae (strain SJ-2008) TaxID=1178016 RepID=I7ADC5_ENCRO|nr:SUMO ubiquitin activating enzyme E1 subunit UBA2 [Encephalitozoon romaleae SJ-2008]AFN82600.1 SUMO ubiquitin activating enzyme E1 subunit UBA2 [Encephalitozoon romaleae SJ-2008]